MDTFQQYVFRSRYARFLPDKKKRESWAETVGRYFDFMESHLQDNVGFKLSKLRGELEDAVLSMSVMPSMRALMSAGPALARDNCAGYNCTYLPVDDPKAFDEAMLLLMCGCGVGFSVERQSIVKLPEIPDRLFETDTTIVVKDSKEGWAKSLRMLLALLWSGEVPKWDLSAVRPSGARLKTFGGRASGPGPLEDCFRFTVAMFRNAVGRRLTSVECHDMMCKVAEAIIVGGVRRSAMISLSNLSDDRMREAKAGQWWEMHGHRALANNSVAYTEKPEVGAFMREWLSLYQSKSGERGIFNREGARRQIAATGRRDAEFEFGVNPCGEIILRPHGFCNLSEAVVRPKDSISTLTNKVRIAAILGTLQSTLTHFPYLRRVWIKNAEEERLLGVSLTGICDHDVLAAWDDPGLPKILDNLRDVVGKANAEYAHKLGIPPAAATTCIKPSGTVSSLVDAAPGIHPRHDRHYIRRVRNDVKDPLTKFMQDAGIPSEADVTKPESIQVFSFPRKAPKGAMVKSDLSPLDHLKLWLIYKQHWTEHNPSVTVAVPENYWPQVGAWVWEHFDDVCGLSFMPEDGGTYRQMPYESTSEDEYKKLEAAMPKAVDFDALVEEESTPNDGRELACTAGGGCDL